MTGQRIELWTEDERRGGPGTRFGTFQSCVPSVTFVQAASPSRGAVVVCPGGGYANKAEHERFPIAERLRDAGIHAYTLDYRVAPDRHPAPSLDGRRAITLARRLAREDSRHADRVAILGFSAGGHLAATCGTIWSDDDERPDAMILSYAVISMDKYGHLGCRTNLLGENSDDQTISDLSLENRVGRRTPPAFIWHTADDEPVPVQNSLMMASALAAKNVPFALRVYPHGRHGLGLAEGIKDVERWFDDCVAFLEELGF